MEKTAQRIGESANCASAMMPYSTWEMTIGAKTIGFYGKNERKTKKSSKTLAKMTRHAYNEGAEIAFSMSNI